MGTAEDAAAESDAKRFDEIGEAVENGGPNLESWGEDTLISFASLVGFVDVDGG